jgi:hypothetical protein
MGRRSNIDSLPPAIRDLIGELIRNGKTIEQIKDHLNAMPEVDGEVSRSSVGRYVRNTKLLMHDYMRAQEMARTWAVKAGEDPNSDVGTLVGEMLKSVAFNVVSNLDMDNPGKTKAMDLMLLTKAVESLESTTRKSMERRAQVRKLAMDEAAKAVAGEAKKLGLTPDAIDRMTKAIGLL